MAEPVREQVLVGTETRLKTIAGVRPWGGSYPRPIDVSRKMPPADQKVADFPKLIVLETDGAAFEHASSSRQGFVMMRHRFPIVVLGFVEDDDTEAASTWLQRLWADVVATLWADGTVGGITGGEITQMSIGAGLRVDSGALLPVRGFAQPVTFEIDEEVAVA